MRSTTDHPNRHPEAFGTDVPHISFPSGGTGSMVDNDLGIRSSDWEFTSDSVQNSVDIDSRIPGMIERAFIIVNIESSAASILQMIPKLANRQVFFDLVDRPPPRPVPASPAVLSAGDTKTPAPLESMLGDLVTEIQSISGLSVTDAARMIGVGRRQFYYLRNDSSTKSTTEKHIRLVAEQLTKIADRVGRDPDRVRAAILMPVGVDSTSYFETAELGEAEALREKLASLLHQIDTRGIRQVKRAIPRKASAKVRTARQSLAMEALAGQTDGSEPVTKERTDGSKR